jgi:L-methionine (R)-S-oxide reductase
MDLLESLRTPDLDASLKALLAHFKCDIGTLHTLGTDGKLHLRAHTPGIPEPILAASRVIPVGKGIAGLAAQNKKAMNMCNLTQDSDPRIPVAAKSSDIVGAICVPMLKGEEVVGTLGIAVRSERTFTPEEEALLTDAGRVIATQLPH